MGLWIGSMLWPVSVMADPNALTVCSASVAPEFREQSSEVEYYFYITNSSYSELEPNADMLHVIINAPENVEMRGAGADVSGGNFYIYPDRVLFNITPDAFPTGSTEYFRVVVDVNSEIAYSSGFWVGAYSAQDETEGDASCTMSVIPDPTPEPDPTSTPDPTPVVITNTETTTVTNTNIIERTVNKIKTVLIKDTTKPVVSISSNIEGVHKIPPFVEGKASDSKGVVRVQYSVDGGKNWLSVDELLGEGKSSASFSFTPPNLLDGNYEVIVRALDPSLNVGISEKQTMIIDRLLPKVGTTLVAIGPQPISPIKNGLVHGLQGVGQTVILSSVGGATSIDLLLVEKDKDDSKHTISMSKKNETGLWYGTINMEKAGLYKMTARAIDGADNKTERELQHINILANGRVLYDNKPVLEAELRVFVLNPNTNRFVMWNGETYSQNNPQIADQEGKYGLILPSGTYYMEVGLDGYRLLRTEIFSIENHTPINTDFSLEKLTTFKLFGKEFYLPTFKKTLVSVSINQPESLFTGEVSSLIGSELPFFILSQGASPLYSSDLVGKPTVLSFLTTWSPLVSEQMEVLDGLMENSGVRTVGVFEQETTSKVKLFMSRGGYETSVWADEDGELVDDFSIHTTPTHVLMDSKGKVRDVVVGFLSEEELLEKLY